MNLQTFLTTVFEFIISPLLILLTSFAVKWINARANNLKAETDNQIVQKYIDMLNKTIATTVTAVNQTYVDDLKNQNAFTIEAQKEAFQRVYDVVINSLTEEAGFYLAEIINDLDAYVRNKIEEQVNIQKMYK